MPPVLANDLRLVDVADAPELRISVLVWEDGLKDVVVEINVLGKLSLVVGAVEAHLKFGFLVRGGGFFDLVHGLEALLSHFTPGSLVDSGERFHAYTIVVKVLVVIPHIRRVGVSNGNVVREFGAPKDILFDHCAGWREKEFGCIGAAGCQ